MSNEVVVNFAQEKEYAAAREALLQSALKAGLPIGQATVDRTIALFRQRTDAFIWPTVTVPATSPEQAKAIKSAIETSHGAWWAFAMTLVLEIYLEKGEAAFHPERGSPGAKDGR